MVFTAVEHKYETRVSGALSFITLLFQGLVSRRWQHRQYEYQLTSFFFLFSYTWEAIDVDRNVLYKINLCFGVEECGRSSAVCAYDINKKAYLSVGR